MSYVYQSITPGDWGSGRAYHANSDGFVLGNVSFPSNAGKGCNCMAYGYCQGVYAMATGGNTGFFGRSWSLCMWSNPNSLLMPVYAGATFYAGVAQMGSGDQQMNAPFSFTWIGPQSSSRNAFHEVDVSTDPDFRPPPIRRLKRAAPMAAKP